MIKVAIITNIIPTYREHFYDIILNNPEYNIVVYCQDKIAGVNINSVHKKFKDKVRIVNSWSPFKNESLVFQFLPFMTLYRDYDIVFVDGNLRHLSQSVLSTVFRLLGKKIVIWSNTYTSGGNERLEAMRLFWWKTFDNFLMYTEKDVQVLKGLGFTKKNIININNGLNQNLIDAVINKWDQKKLDNFKKENNIISDNIILSSSRVNEGNEHLLALQAVKVVKKSIPDVLWLVIGDGNEIERLKDLIIANDLSDNVMILGEIYDENLKCPWFLISKIFVHPGPIGLSIFNAFGYSLPVITHDNERHHNAEFSLFEDKKTGYLYKYKDKDDLALKITELFNEREESAKMRSYVYKIVKERYNTEVMASQFIKMLNSTN